MKRKSNQSKVERLEKSGMSKINDMSLILPEDTEKVSNLSDSMNGRLYRDVADAAQEAFMSAAYAAVAAKAAVELFRAESLDPENRFSPDFQSEQVFSAPDSMNSTQQISSESSLDSDENISKYPTSCPDIDGNSQT